MFLLIFNLYSTYIYISLYTFIYIYFLIYSLILYDNMSNYILIITIKLRTHYLT